MFKIRNIFPVKTTLLKTRNLIKNKLQRFSITAWKTHNLRNEFFLIFTYLHCKYDFLLIKKN